MTVRKRKWRDKQGHEHEKWMIHIEHTWPDGRKEVIRKVSPVQTKRGAEQYEREIRSQLVSGQWKEAATEHKIPTLAEFAEEFLAYQATLNKPDVMALKRHVLKRHILPALGQRRLDQIDERVLDNYTVAKIEYVTPRGTLLEPRTVNQQVKLIARMLRVARKWKIIREVPSITLLKERNSDFDFLDFEEADVFLAAAAQYPRWHPYMMVGVRTGLRVGEMVALRWREDVDLRRGRVVVQRSYSRETREFVSTKNDKIRELPLTWDAIEALRIQRGQTSGELVFPGVAGKVLRDKVVNEAMAKICEAADFRRIHSHVLRHTFASHAVMRGIPLRQVQEWLGHGSIVVTMRYAHLSRGVGDELIQRLSPKPAGGAPQDAAELQHMDSTRSERPSKSAPHTPVEPRF